MLVQLPVELLTQIAFQASPEDLVAFANTCTLLRAASIAPRYHTVTLGDAIGVDDEGELDEESLMELKLVVRSMLADVAVSERKMSAIRVLRILEYSWMQEEDVKLLIKIVEGAIGLETLQMALNEETTLPDYLKHIQGFWDAVQHAPSLRTLLCQCGPAVPLRLDEFASRLTRIDLSEYAVEEEDGTLPPGLRVLTLRFVEIYEDWFGPELFNTLEMLLLRNMQEPALRTIIRKVEAFVALGGTSNLETLSLHLYPSGFYFLQEQNFLILERLLGAFKPESFPRLHSLELLSTPGSESFALSARSLAAKIPQFFPRLEELKLCLGTGGTLLSLRYSAESLTSFASALAPAQALTHLTMNILDIEEVSSEQAAVFFRSISSLQHVSIRGSSSLKMGAQGYRVVRSAEGALTGIEDDGVRALVGEDIPEDCEVVEDGGAAV